MNAALRQLLRLRVRGNVRKALRVMKTPRGIVFSVLGGMIFVVWFGPTVLAIMFSPPTDVDPKQILLFAPAVLFLICLLNTVSRLGRSALYFTPAEIDFLFPAPVTRLNLLLYKLSGIVAASLGLGLVAGAFLARVVHSPLASIVATTLALLFVNLVSVIGALLKENVLKGGSMSARLLTLCGMGILVGMLAVPIWTRTPGMDMQATLGEIIEAPSIALVLAPFRVFVLAMVSETLAGVAGWSMVALALNLVAFAIISRLDAINTESALHSSRRQFDRLQAARSQKHTTWKGAARWRFPQLPSFGGAGGIAWRQLTTALRGSRAIAMYFFVLAAIFSVLFVLSDGETQEVLIGAVAVPAVFLTFFLIALLRFDFRGELDHIEWLKMLPASSYTLVIGELITPIAILTGVQWVIAAFAMLAIGYSEYIVPAAAFLLPVNIVLVGTENMLFLMYPTRNAAAGLGDLQSLGRNVVLVLVRTVLFAVWAGLAVLIGLAVYLVSGSWTAMVVTTWLIMMVTCFGVIPATAVAFRKFDVSVHMPA